MSGLIIKRGFPVPIKGIESRGDKYYPPDWNMEHGTLTTQGSPLWNWCWTLNNYTADEEKAVAQLADVDEVKYICYGKEVGANSTPHLQGYLELAKKKRLGGVKKLVGLARAHFEPRRGTQLQAIKYCQKDGSFFEYGEKKLDSTTNLKQDRLKVLKKLADEGSSPADLFNADPVIYCQCYKAIERLASFNTVVRIRDLEVHLYHGKPGTGKTRQAYERYPKIYAFPIGKVLWADGYYGQKEVLLDDFSGNMRLVDTLRFLDRYPIQIPIKGGFVQWCPDLIIITTNVHPKLWYDYSKRTDSEKALKRRITKVIDFDNEKEEISLDIYWHVV